MIGDFRKMKMHVAEIGDKMYCITFFAEMEEGSGNFKSVIFTCDKDGKILHCDEGMHSRDHDEAYASGSSNCHVTGGNCYYDGRSVGEGEALERILGLEEVTLLASVWRS